MRTQPPLLLPIFRSGNQARLLALLFFSEKGLSIQSMSQHLGIAYPTVHREVNRLEKAGLIMDNRIGNTHFYIPNEGSRYFDPLKKLLDLSMGPVPMLTEGLLGISGISRAMIFGSWAHRSLGVSGSAPHDIDLMIVGHPIVKEIYALCSQVSEQIGLQVNPTIFTEVEWRSDTPFLRQLRSGGVIKIVSSPEDNLDA